MSKNTVCLWFNGGAEAAARFYAQVFPDSAVSAVHRAPSDFPGGKAELVTAATYFAGEEMTRTIADYVDEPNPVAAFAHMWSDVLIGTDFEGGCPIMAAACSGAEAPDAKAAAAEVFASWGRLLTARWVRDGITEAVALVPRVVAVVGQVEVLLGQFSDVLGRVQEVVDRVDGVLVAVDRTRERADEAITAIDATRPLAEVVDDILRLAG